MKNKSLPKKTPSETRRVEDIHAAWPSWLARHPRFELSLAEGRSDWAATLLLAGMWILLEPLPPDQRDAFIDDLVADPDALDRVLTAADEWIDAQKR